MNLLTQVSFDGTEEPYFFENDFTTHPPRSTNQCMRDTLERKFAQANVFTFQTGTGHIAGVMQNGTEIADEASLFPYEVILVPNRELFPKEDMYEGENMLDFFSNWEPVIDEDGKMEAVTLFDVKARHDPDDRSVAELPRIGRIRLTSELYRSTFGDERLFFQHEVITRDHHKLSF